MLQSQLFTKTLRKAPKEAETISHKYLVRGGFIDQLMAGVYSLLPLGFRVYKKIEEIIREEINAIGGQELFLPALQKKEQWLETGRWNVIDPPLFKFKDRHNKELALGSTHEEPITDLARKFITSYKDLPCSLYQIQDKFRNEMRSTGGLLRVREFVMKDLYSFHTTEEDLDNYYWRVGGAYKKIFTRCGLKVKVIEALGGSIGGEVTHEFTMLCPTGEDKVLYCTKCDWAVNIEALEKKKITKCPKCSGKISEGRGIENGHVFKLGTKYSEAMGATFTDEKGERKPIWMGCYGIGLGRLMATIVEAHHDERGIIWPASVAPYKVHLLTISSQQSTINNKINKITENLYRVLQNKNISVLYDNREGVSAGEKFADSDLIGIPLRLVISEKTLEKDSVEVKKRGEKKVELVKLDKVVDALIIN